MPWEIVILVGGGYALASGSKVTIQLSSWSNIGSEASWESITALKERLEVTKGEHSDHQVTRKDGNMVEQTLVPPWPSSLAPQVRTDIDTSLATPTLSQAKGSGDFIGISFLGSH